VICEPDVGTENAAERRHQECTSIRTRARGVERDQWIRALKPCAHNPPFNNSVAGGTSGLGLAILEALVVRGVHDVVILSRKVE
jgi:hypothetical protein